MRDEEAVFWAEGRQAVTGRRRRAVGAVVLAEAPLEVSDEQALPVLLEVRCRMPAKYLHGALAAPVKMYGMMWRPTNVKASTDDFLVG